MKFILICCVSFAVSTFGDWIDQCNQETFNMISDEYETLAETFAREFEASLNTNGNMLQNSTKKDEQEMSLQIKSNDLENKSETSGLQSSNIFNEKEDIVLFDEEQYKAIKNLFSENEDIDYNNKIQHIINSLEDDMEYFQGIENEKDITETIKEYLEGFDSEEDMLDIYLENNEYPGDVVYNDKVAGNVHDSISPFENKTENFENTNTEGVVISGGNEDQTFDAFYINWLSNSENNKNFERSMVRVDDSVSEEFFDFNKKLHELNFIEVDPSTMETDTASSSRHQTKRKNQLDEDSKVDISPKISKIKNENINVNNIKEEQILNSQTKTPSCKPQTAKKLDNKPKNANNNNFELQNKQNRDLNQNETYNLSFHQNNLSFLNFLDFAKNLYKSYKFDIIIFCNRLYGTRFGRINNLPDDKIIESYKKNENIIKLYILIEDSWNIFKNINECKLQLVEKDFSSLLVKLNLLEKNFRKLFKLFFQNINYSVYGSLRNLKISSGMPQKSLNNFFIDSINLVLNHEYIKFLNGMVFELTFIRSLINTPSISIENLYDIYFTLQMVIYYFEIHMFEIFEDHKNDNKEDIYKLTEEKTTAQDILIIRFLLKKIFDLFTKNNLFKNILKFNDLLIFVKCLDGVEAQKINYRDFIFYLNTMLTIIPSPINIWRKPTPLGIYINTIKNQPFLHELELISDFDKFYKKIIKEFTVNNNPR